MIEGRIPEKLVQFIQEEAGKANYKLVDFSTRGGRTSFMEIVLDKEGGITLDECSEFNRKITAWIEEEGIFGSEYTLDVCSPGLDRELKSDNDFNWAIGKDVEVRTHEPVEGKNVTVGKLVKADSAEGVVIEESEGNKVSIDRDNIAKIKLWVSMK